MNIELHCEGCGKKLNAPASAGGKRSKCPACGHELYIPLPADDLDELPMAPEDQDDARREAALQAERRALEHALSREKAPAEERRATATAAGAGSRSVEATVIAYLVAMRDSNLPVADAALAELLHQREEARRILDRLITEPIPPARLGDIPNAVYQGFLKNLRSQL